ncbi:MAG: aminotransferase class I/II-fold pyridoxal phosphate-dependent enzyme [Candidatus Promineifilaceae bacterium]
MGAGNRKESNFNTIGIHGGEEHNPTSAVSSPIFQSATFGFLNPDDISAAMASKAHPQFYGRYATPNTKQVESILAKLEGGEAGLAVASGMAAVALVLLNQLKTGDHLVAQRNIYPTTYNFIRRKLPQFGIDFTFVDQEDSNSFEQAIRSETRLLYVESPANPMLSLTDLEDVSRLAKTHDLISVVDNTFATPYNQRPLELGCDIVLHSATKYLSGHSDVVAGVIVSDQDTMERMWHDHVLFGSVLHPFEAWLLGRGLKTFGIRMERHNQNAMDVASFLLDHPKIDRVFYPGLVVHPQHSLARDQMLGGYGGMVSFSLKGGKTAAFRFLEGLELITLAVSLGGVHSLISHPQSTISSVQADEVRTSVGIEEGLLRLSVGLEDDSDILSDIEKALSAL